MITQKACIFRQSRTVHAATRRQLDFDSDFLHPPPFLCSFCRTSQPLQNGQNHHAVVRRQGQSLEEGKDQQGFAISAATLHRLRVEIVHIFVVSKAGSAASGWDGVRPRTDEVTNTAWNVATSRKGPSRGQNETPEKLRRRLRQSVAAN